MRNEVKHADFNNRNEKSSNDVNEKKKTELNSEEPRDLKSKKNLNSLTESEKKDIAKAMDKMRHNIEMIPGEHQEQEES